MNRRDLEHRIIGLHGRGGAVHWLASAILFVLVWAAGLAPAPAFATSAGGFASETPFRRNVVPIPRQVEADLPDLVDTAHPCQVDPDSGIPQRSDISAPTASTRCIPIRPAAGLSSPARAFNPRAPPILR
jgi:hypothetical protein